MPEVSSTNWTTSTVSFTSTIQVLCFETETSPITDTESCIDCHMIFIVLTNVDEDVVEFDALLKTFSVQKHFALFQRQSRRSVNSIQNPFRRQDLSLPTGLYSFSKVMTRTLLGLFLHLHSKEIQHCSAISTLMLCG